VSAGGSSNLPALDPKKNLLSLTTDEKGLLCDWVDNALGGYGTSFPCQGGGSVRNYTDRAACIANGLQYLCTIVTVGDIETCTDAQVPTHGCDTPAPACNHLYCM